MPSSKTADGLEIEAQSNQTASYLFGISVGSMIPSLPNGAPFLGFGPASPGSFPVSYSTGMNSITLSDGTLSLKVENGFPSDITSLQIEFNNVGGLFLLFCSLCTAYQAFHARKNCCFG